MNDYRGKNEHYKKDLKLFKSKEFDFYKRKENTLCSLLEVERFLGCAFKTAKCIEVFKLFRH